MKALVKDIIAKISTLPDNVRELARIDSENASLAMVQSASAPDKIYTAHIAVHKDDSGGRTLLRAVCPCDSVTLCWHSVGFYAVAKGMLPKEASEVRAGPKLAELEADALDRLSMDLSNALAAWIGGIKRFVEEQKKDNMITFKACLLARERAALKKNNKDKERPDDER